MMIPTGDDIKPMALLDVLVSYAGLRRPALDQRVRLSSDGARQRFDRLRPIFVDELLELTEEPVGCQKSAGVCSRDGSTELTGDGVSHLPGRLRLQRNQFLRQQQR